MRLIQETLKRIKFNSKIQMLLWAGFFVVVFFFFLVLLFFFQRSYLRRFGKLLSIFLLNLLQPAVGLKNTHTWTHTRWPVSVVSLPHAYRQAAGPDASCSALLEKPENHRARLWSNANYSSLKKQREKGKKKDLSCQLLDKHRLLWREREKRRRRDRTRHSESVKAREVKWGKREERREKEQEKEGEGDSEEGGNVILVPLV